MRLAVVTGSRAEYGLLHPLLAALEADSRFDVGLVVTGSHLDERFGMTVREIEDDDFRIDARVKLPLDDDSELGIARATGEAVSGVAAALAANPPDLVIILGDRYEALAAATAAALLRVPVAHLHGGELTEGAVDDSIRHAITKLSTLHFTSTDEYRHRVIQMGEDSARVFTVGALGVDNAMHTQLVAVDRLAADLGFSFEFPTALVTFHPVTLGATSGVEQVDELLAALDALPQLRVLFTLPNADAGNREIAKRIDAWVAATPIRSKAFASLGRVRYLSALAACDVVVGNSSSGIIEAPSFGKPTVDIGDRQLGRVHAESVLHCEPERAAISAAISVALTRETRDAAVSTVNPYGDGHAAERIVSAIISRFGTGLSTRKHFFDISFPLADGKQD